MSAGSGKGKQRLDRFVRCGHHGPSLGYAVCRHIARDGEPTAYVREPEDSTAGIGSIVCARGGPAHSADDVLLVCRYCARDQGWTAVGGGAAQ